MNAALVVAPQRLQRPFLYPQRVAGDQTVQLGRGDHANIVGATDRARGMTRRPGCCWTE